MQPCLRSKPQAVTCMLPRRFMLKGRVVVTPDDGGEPVEVKAGDLVTFPAGMSCTWDVKEVRLCTVGALVVSAEQRGCCRFRRRQFTSTTTFIEAVGWWSACPLFTLDGRRAPTQTLETLECRIA